MFRLTDKKVMNGNEKTHTQVCSWLKGLTQVRLTQCSTKFVASKLTNTVLMILSFYISSELIAPCSYSYSVYNQGLRCNYKTKVFSLKHFCHSPDISVYSSFSNLITFLRLVLQCNIYAAAFGKHSQT